MPTTEKPHILVLPRWYPNPTDIQLGIFIQRQIHLMQSEFNFTVIYVQAMDNLAEPFVIETKKVNTNITEHYIYYRKDTSVLRKVKHIFRHKKAQKLGLNQLKTLPDLCHVHVPYRSAWPALQLKKQHRIPFVITEHWSGHLNGLFQKKNSLDKWLYRNVLKKSCAISTVSEVLKKAFLKNTGVNSTVIPNYIEQSTDTETNRPETDKIQLLSVGDLTDQTKNFTGLLNTFVEIIQMHPQFHLTIIGGGPDENKIKQLVDDLALHNVVTLTGRQPHEEVLKRMQSCDIYICNSRFETFGMTVAEALRCGKPVIATQCGGPEEFLTEENGIAIPVQPINDNMPFQPLQEAILTMSKRYKKYPKEKTQQAMESRFGKETIRRKWSLFYRQCIAEN